MGVAAERLVRDRLAEFKRIAQSKNTLAPAAGPAAKDAGGKPGFMREFFTAVGQIQATLGKGRANVKLMGGVLEESLQATTQEKQRAVSERFQALQQETAGLLASSNQALLRLKAQSDEEERLRPNSSEGKIRTNMQQAMAKKHKQLVLDFQQAQIEHKEALQRRQAREMEILMPDASPEDRAEMIAAGETTQLIVARKMAGAHALLLDEVERIREKHQEILRIEASIADLHQMFQDMAVLVEAQGEMLDCIEAHVHKTKGYTAKAEKELLITRKTQRSTQKWMCCLSVVLMVVLISVLAPVLIKKG